VLVDPAVWPWRGRLWAHLVSDQSYAELHDFAARLGVPRRGFQGDHYDIPAALREHALALGAEDVTARELLRRLKAAGLRRPRPAGHDPALDPALDPAS
jgi:hypothetical protein